MKKGVASVVRLLALLLGLLLFFFGIYKCVGACMEIANSKIYTFKAPYSSYELSILNDKWIGLGCIVVGLIILIAMLTIIIYRNKHIQNSDGLYSQTNMVKCNSCGLSVSIGLAICPRCGMALSNYTMPGSMNNSAVSPPQSVSQPMPQFVQQFRPNSNSQSEQETPAQPVSQLISQPIPQNAAETKAVTLYCTKCGNPIVSGDAYCAKCGNKENLI
ncbi:MAG: hypothetical protein Q4G58_15140 [bacterium]|nr:hypothetical protein [bacterium]